MISTGEKVAVNGLLGRKRGMVQVIQDDGTVAGCTVLEVGPCAVTQIRTLDRDGYQAIQLGFENSLEWKISRAERGHTATNGALRHLAEFDADSYDDLSLGQTITITDIFTVGDRVDIQGIGKGKGFAGTVKRHHFSGGPRTHGQSDRHRAPGSVGAGSTPGRVLKGTRMAGRMGGKAASTINLRIIKLQPERGLVYVGGSVPGATNGLIKIRKTKRQG